VTKLELLKAIYGAVDWQKLYETLPELTRQQADEFFQELRRLVGEAPEPAREAAAIVREGEALLYCDGASRGNPGPAGTGMVLAAPDGREVLAWGESIGRATNNVAEYRAAIAGLRKALELGVRRIRLLSDSELLVRQLQGRYRVRHANLQPLHRQATELLARFDGWEAARVARDENARADALAAQHAVDPAP
jgi:ribonuclease HI